MGTTAVTLAYWSPLEWLVEAKYEVHYTLDPFITAPKHTFLYW